MFTSWHWQINLFVEQVKDNDMFIYSSFDMGKQHILKNEIVLTNKNWPKINKYKKHIYYIFLG